MSSSQKYQECRTTKIVHLTLSDNRETTNNEHGPVISTINPKKWWILPDYWHTSSRWRWRASRGSRSPWRHRCWPASSPPAVSIPRCRTLGYSRCPRPCWRRCSRWCWACSSSGEGPWCTATSVCACGDKICFEKNVKSLLKGEEAPVLLMSLTVSLYTGPLDRINDD